MVLATVQTERLCRFVGDLFEQQFIQEVFIGYEQQAKYAGMAELVSAGYLFTEDERVWNIGDDFWHFAANTLVSEVEDEFNSELEYEDYVDEMINDNYYELAELLADDVQIVLDRHRIFHTTLRNVELDENSGNIQSCDATYVNKPLQEVW